MKLIKPSFEIVPQPLGLAGMLQQIERAGRTCYKSESAITPDSSKAFVDRLIKSGHGAMLEHGTVYLKLKWFCVWSAIKYRLNKYSVVKGYGNVTTNYRVLVENNWLADLQYLTDDHSAHEERISVKFICDRGVTHELVRHRVASFAQESTRYCNYSKAQFGGDITYIIPPWIELKRVYGEDLNEDFGSYLTDNDEWLHSLKVAEIVYFKKLKQGWTPQQARSILPNSLKSEIFVTASVPQWHGIFKLRDASTAHPQMAELMKPLHEAFKRWGLLC